MSRWRVSSPGSIIILLCVVALAVILIFSTIQVYSGKNIGVYDTPEEGLYSLVGKEYRGVQRVEIARVDRKVFDHLWYVKAYVYAAGRADDDAPLSGGYAEKSCFFVRVKDGWTFVHRDRFPKVVALNQWLLGCPI